MHAHVGASKWSGRPVASARLDQILHHFALAVDRDRPATRQLGHVDVVPLSSESEVEAVVAQAFAPEPRAHADLVQQIDRALFEHAGAHAFDHIVAVAVLEDDRIDALQVQQLPQQQPRRPGADDADLGARAWSSAQISRAHRPVSFASATRARSAARCPDRRRCTSCRRRSGHAIVPVDTSQLVTNLAPLAPSGCPMRNSSAIGIHVRRVVRNPEAPQ